MKTGYVQNPRIRVPYMTFGDGPKNLVLLPGMSVRSLLPSAAAVASSYAAFTRDFTVTLIDRALCMPDPCSIEEMARNAAEAMELLGIGQADIVGMSQGGMIAQVLAAQYPEKVGRLVLCSTSCYSTPVSVAAFEAWSALGRAGDAEALNRDAFARIYSGAYLEKYAAAFRALEKEGTTERMRQFAVMAEANLAFDFRTHLGAIRAPTLVIGSWADGVFGGEPSVVISSILHCSLFLSDHFAHASYDENPEVRSMILSFLTR